MKKIIKIAVVLITFSVLYACKSQPLEFPDFPYNTTYFPIQHPARTLVFGDYMYENDDDCTFRISAVHGGGYENKKNVTVGFVVDNSLTDNLYLSATSSVLLKAMPESWYTLSSANQIIIPKGERSGGVTVTLKDAFFEDPNSINTYWVIPLRMTSTTADSILVGDPAVVNPDVRIAADWVTPPKNYTVFGVKYVNEWHGRYLLQGASVNKEADGSVVETITYRGRYLEESEVVGVTTVGRHQVRYSKTLRQSASQGGNIPGEYIILLDFDPVDKVSATLSQGPNSAHKLTGTAKMVKNAGSWGDIARDVIYLDYKVEVEANNRIYEIKDTLTFRDKNVRYEEYTPSVRP